MNHPLHEAVADAISKSLPQNVEFVRDPACRGEQHLPLFVGKRKARDTRMCCVDLLLLFSGRVRGIVEIEESGFLPTKICGKFLQAALADHFIHDTRREGPVSYGERVLFVQVIDGSSCLKDASRKEQQAQLIESQIGGLLPLRGLTEYRLFFIDGAEDQVRLKALAAGVSKALAEPQDQSDA
jgi:hypothetical protein